MRGTKSRMLELPESKQSRIGSISSGEKNVGVQKQAIHLSGATVRDCVWIKAKFSHFSSGTLIVFRCSRTGQEKLCFSFGRVAFHRHDNRRANQNAILAGLGCDEPTFLDAIPFSQLGGNYNRPAF